MDNNIVNFIRDRFNSLETSMSNGFEDVKDSMAQGFGKHETRIRSLEDDRLEKKVKLVAYGTVGGGISMLLAWIIGKVF